MKVIETRNLYVDYRIDGTTSTANLPYEAKWATMYVMKQLIRLISIKQMKSAVRSAELITPDTIDKMYEGLRNNNPSHK